MASPAVTKLGLPTKRIFIVNPALPKLEDWGEMRQLLLWAKGEVTEKRRNVEFPGGGEEGLLP